jgi:hypothetical protein
MKNGSSDDPRGWKKLRFFRLERPQFPVMSVGKPKSSTKEFPAPDRRIFGPRTGIGHDRREGGLNLSALRSHHRDGTTALAVCRGI